MSLFCGRSVVLSLSSLAIILLRKRVCVALLKLYRGCPCAVSLPHGAMVWYAVSVWGIFWINSLTFSPLAGKEFRFSFSVTQM